MQVTTQSVVTVLTVLALAASGATAQQALEGELPSEVSTFKCGEVTVRGPANTQVSLCEVELFDDEFSPIRFNAASQTSEFTDSKGRAVCTADTAVDGATGPFIFGPGSKCSLTRGSNADGDEWTGQYCIPAERTPTALRIHANADRRAGLREARVLLDGALTTILPALDEDVHTVDLRETVLDDDLPSGLTETDCQHKVTIKGPPSTQISLCEVELFDEDGSRIPFFNVGQNSEFTDSKGRAVCTADTAVDGATGPFIFGPGSKCSLTRGSTTSAGDTWTGAFCLTNDQKADSIRIHTNSQRRAGLRSAKIILDHDTKAVTDNSDSDVIVFNLQDGSVEVEQPAEVTSATTCNNEVQIQGPSNTRLSLCEMELFDVDNNRIPFFNVRQNSEFTDSKGRAVCTADTAVDGEDGPFVFGANSKCSLTRGQDSAGDKWAGSFCLSNDQQASTLRIHANAEHREGLRNAKISVNGAVEAVLPALDEDVHVVDLDPNFDSSASLAQLVAQRLRAGGSN